MEDEISRQIWELEMLGKLIQRRNSCISEIADSPVYEIVKNQLMKVSKIQDLENEFKTRSKYGILSHLINSLCEDYWSIKTPYLDRGYFENSIRTSVLSHAVFECLQNLKKEKKRIKKEGVM